jgi:hypothetical protein
MGIEKTATVNAAELKGIAMAAEAILHHKPTTATIFFGQPGRNQVHDTLRPAQTLG